MATASIRGYNLRIIHPAKGRNQMSIDFAEYCEQSACTEAFADIVCSGAADASDGYLRVIEGIAARLASPKGKSLSPKQMDVVRAVVQRFCDTHECRCCGASEVEDVFALLRSRLCSYHEWTLDRD